MPTDSSASTRVVEDVVIDGLAVYRRGTPGAPRVVLVHGAMDRAGGFVKVLRRLVHLDLIRYDRRGYGGSRGGPSGRGSGEGRVHTTVAGHVDDLFTVLDGRPATVVGHSLGGVVALAAAARRPDLVPSVAAFEAPLAWRSSWPPPPGGSWGEPGGPDGQDEEMAERFLRRMLGDAIWERFPPAMQRARRAEGPALVAELRAMNAGEVVVDPAAITVPVLTGYGDQSRAHHREAARTIAAEAPLGEVEEFAGAGHPAHYTHPAAFAAFVERAVARAG
jgi:pimeloyl-ACP methyl ester carboxylesterase